MRLFSVFVGYGRISPCREEKLSVVLSKYIDRKSSSSISRDAKGCHCSDNSCSGFLVSHYIRFFVFFARASLIYFL